MLTVRTVFEARHGYASMQAVADMPGNLLLNHGHPAGSAKRAENYRNASIVKDNKPLWADWGPAADVRRYK